jgi:O-antigen ligase/polysaccharide polymerase Wzy-like membrane protein
MSITLAEAARRPTRLRAALGYGLLAPPLAGAGVLAVVAASRTHSNRELLAISIGIVLSVALALIAVTNFKAAVLALLAGRASLDSFHHASHIDPGTALGALFVVLATLWLAARFAAGEMKPISRTAMALLGLAVAGVITAFASASPATSLSAAARIAGGGLMVVVLEQFIADDPRIVRHLWTVVLGSGLIPITVAIYQWDHHQGGFIDSSGFSRISGTFVHPDSFATYLAMALTTAYVLYTTRRRRFAVFAVFAVGVFALFLTYSRGGWIACALAISLVTWRARRKLVVPVAICVVGAAFLVPGVTHRLADIHHGPRQNGTPTNSLSWRFYYWRQTYAYFRSEPFTGVGLDSVQRLNAQAAEPHNFVVQAGAEMGVVGLFAAGLLVMFTWRDLRRARQCWPAADPVVLVASGATVVLLIQALVTNVMTEGVIYWYWAALAAPALTRQPRMLISRVPNSRTERLFTAEKGAGEMSV